MLPFILGSLFILVYVMTTLAILLAPETFKGCPKCHRRSGLRKRGNWVWSGWLAFFHGGIRRHRCEHCGWRGILKG